MLLLGERKDLDAVESSEEMERRCIFMEPELRERRWRPRIGGLRSERLRMLRRVNWTSWDGWLAWRFGLTRSLFVVFVGVGVGVGAGVGVGVVAFFDVVVAFVDVVVAFVDVVVFVVVALLVFVVIKVVKGTSSFVFCVGAVCEGGEPDTYLV